MLAKTCDNCPYGNCAAKKHLPPSGPVDLVIVSERPHLEDINTGKMFSDSSGNLFKRILGFYGGLPQGTTAYATPAIRCMAPIGAPIKSEALSACSFRLREELLIAKPRLILAMGNSAIRAITGDYDTQITKIAGQIIQTDFGPVLACMAPAAVERRPEDLEGFHSVIRKMIHYLKFGELPNPGKTKYVVVDKEEDVPKWIEALSKYKLLAADIETEGFNPFTRDVITLGMAWAKNKVVIFDRKVIPLLKPLFDMEHIKWIWHNGKFDTKFLNLNPMLMMNTRIDHDTMLMHYCLNEIKGTHDLEQLAVNYLGADAYEDGVKRYLDKDWGYKFAPRAVLDPYLAKDCDYTFQLFEYMLPLLEADKNPGRGKDLKWLYSELLIPAAKFLNNVETNGIWVNPEARQDAEDFYASKEAELQETIQTIAAVFWDADRYVEDTGAKKKPAAFSPSSPKQLNWLIYNRLRLRSSKRLPQDTSEATLQTLEPRHPLIEALLELRKISKILSTYIRGAAEFANEYADGRVHSQYLIHGTMTGRLASRYPNMQNIPRSGPARELYQAPPGKRFLEVDYAAAELRVGAVVSNDVAMLEIFLSGRNLHKEVAKELYGPDYTEGQYVRAKAVNFGIFYGRTSYTLALEHNISQAEGDRMISKWLGRFPQAHQFIKDRRADVPARRDIRALTGRIRRFPVVRAEFMNAAQNEAVNFPMQSVGSDMTLASGIEMESTLWERWGIKIVNIVHDSLLFEMDDDDDMMAEVKEYVADVMLQVPKRILETEVPFIVDFKHGYKWGALNK